MPEPPSGRARPAPLYPRIVKPRGGAGVSANLADYERACRGFTWAAARALLDGLPGGRGLNIAHEAVDRHADGPRADRHALRWIGQAGGRRSLTYRDLRAATNRFANALRQPGRAGRRQRVRARRAHPRALHRHARRAEGEMRRRAAVLRLRPGADRHPARDRRGPRAGDHRAALSPQGRRPARAAAAAGARHPGARAGPAGTRHPGTHDWRALVESAKPRVHHPADRARGPRPAAFHQRHHRPARRARSMCTRRW